MRQFAVRVLTAIAIGVVLSPFVGWLLPDVAKHRIVQRTIIGALILLIVPLRNYDPRTWTQGIQDLGLRGPHRFGRFWTGVGVATVLFGSLLLSNWLLDGRGPTTWVFTRNWAQHLAGALAAGFVIGWLEEFFFRGYLRRHIGGWWSAVVYSGVHLFRPLQWHGVVGDEFDPWLGVRMVPRMFESWADPRAVLVGFPSLLLFGLALNRLAHRTGTLWAGVGLHAGVVFAASYYRRFLDTSTDHPWIFGGPRLYDGVLGLIAMALFLVLASRAPLPRFLRA